jgi:hypothetical protein
MWTSGIKKMLKKIIIMRKTNYGSHPVLTFYPYNFY